MPDIPLHVSSTHMDFLTAIEADILFPVAFRDRSALTDWAGVSNLKIHRIGRFDPEKSAVLLSGAIPVWGGGARYYSQIWVRAGYGGYRKSLLRHLKESEAFTSAMPSLDADHAVSRKRLSQIWPDAWVNLILVDRPINRAIGAMLEKDNLRVRPHNAEINANLEFLLKLFLKADKKLSRESLQEYFNEVSGHFLQKCSDLNSFAMVSNADGFLTEVAENWGIQNQRPATFFALRINRKPMEV